MIISKSETNQLKNIYKRIELEKVKLVINRKTINVKV